MMRVFFPADPLHPRQPDPDYAEEVAAVEALDIAWSPLHFEAVLEDSGLSRALRFVPELAEVELGVYRGWMLTPAAYAKLHAALALRRVELINSPDAYRHAHYLPESYPIIQEHTARTVWLRCGRDVAMDEIRPLLETFGDRPIIVKDWVKSRKHEWHEACFIPSAADSAAVERVVRRFLKLQGVDLAEGLVFREFLPLESIGRHSRSGMPLVREYRLFFLNGELLARTNYWEEGDYRGEPPPLDLFADLARRVRSRFFTMDVARRLDGEWVIVELGDAQVAGLPEGLDPETFYRKLRDRLSTAK